MIRIVAFPTQPPHWGFQQGPVFCAVHRVAHAACLEWFEDVGVVHFELLRGVALEARLVRFGLPHRGQAVLFGDFMTDAASLWTGTLHRVARDRGEYSGRTGLGDRRD